MMRNDGLPQASAPPSAAATVAPSYDDIQRFLLSLLHWVQQATERLSCSAPAAQLRQTVRKLTAYTTAPADQTTPVSRGPSHGVSPPQWVDAVDVDAAATLSIELSVLWSVLVLLGWWWVLVKVLAWTLPGLRVRTTASRMREHLRHSDAQIAQDALLSTKIGALRRGSNRHQLLAAGFCTAVAALLIALLLTVHVWTGLVMWKLWETCTRPLTESWRWATTVLLPQPSSREVPGSSLAAAAAVPFSDSVMARVLTAASTFLWQLSQQMQAMYLWHVLGTVVLGLSLWLLQYAHERMHTFNASLAFVTSRSSEPQLLHQLNEAAARRRERRTTQLQVEAARSNQLLLERLEELRRETLMVQSSAAVAQLEDVDRACATQQEEERSGGAADADADAAAAATVSDNKEVEEAASRVIDSGEKVAVASGSAHRRGEDAHRCGREGRVRDGACVGDADSDVAAASSAETSTPAAQ